jgi:hypothetical protein
MNRVAFFVLKMSFQNRIELSENPRFNAAAAGRPPHFFWS